MSRTFNRPFLDLQEAGLKVSLTEERRKVLLTAGEPEAYQVELSPPDGRSWRAVLKEAFPEGTFPEVQMLVYWSPASPIRRLLERVELDPDRDGPVVASFTREWYQHGPDNTIMVRIVVTGDTEGVGPLSAREKGSILFEQTLKAGATQGDGGYIRISAAEITEGAGKIAFDGNIYHILVNDQLESGERATAIAQLLARCLRHAYHARDEYRTEDGTGEDEGSKGNKTIESLLRATDGEKSVEDLVRQESSELAHPDGTALERWCWKTVWDNWNDPEGEGR